MPDPLGKIGRKFDVNGKDTTVFLFTLLLAFGIWVFHGLSLQYTEVVKLPLMAECNLDGHSSVSASSVTVLARCRTTGFDLIRLGKASQRPPLRLLFSAEDLHCRSGELYYATADDLNRYAGNIFGDKATVLSFLSDTLYFRFPYEEYKKVPVLPVASVTYKGQYMSAEGIRTVPDSVIVYGDPSHLASVSSVSTRSFSLENVSSSAHGKVALELSEGLRISVSAVDYLLDVQRYVEISAKLPVQTRGVPGDRNLIVFPSVADLRLRCAFPVSADPLSSVGLYIDYADFSKSLGGECVPYVSGLPSTVLEYSVSPAVFSIVDSER